MNDPNGDGRGADVQPTARPKKEKQGRRGGGGEQFDSVDRDNRNDYYRYNNSGRNGGDDGSDRGGTSRRRRPVDDATPGGEGEVVDDDDDEEEETEDPNDSLEPSRTGRPFAASRQRKRRKKKAEEEKDYHCGDRVPAPAAAARTAAATADESAAAAASPNRGGGYHDAKFPVKLHYMLCEIEKDGSGESIISWSPDGNGFRVHNFVKLEQELLPLWFRQKKFGSLIRQLNNYGFKKKERGKNVGTFTHPMFLRARPELCDRMQRRGQKDRDSNTARYPSQRSGASNNSTKETYDDNALDAATASSLSSASPSNTSGHDNDTASYLQNILNSRIFSDQRVSMSHLNTNSFAQSRTLASEPSNQTQATLQALQIPTANLAPLNAPSAILPSLTTNANPNSTCGDTVSTLASFLLQPNSNQIQGSLFAPPQTNACTSNLILQQQLLNYPLMLQQLQQPQLTSLGSTAGIQALLSLDSMIGHAAASEKSREQRQRSQPFTSLHTDNQDRKHAPLMRAAQTSEQPNQQRPTSVAAGLPAPVNTTNNATMVPNDILDFLLKAAAGSKQS